MTRDARFGADDGFPCDACSVRRNAPQHTSRDFEADLGQLRGHLLAMGVRCERIVGLGFDGFSQGAPQRLRDVLALDAQIDRDEREIHALVLRILALRQPLAGDLRFLATALRLIRDLERIGDEAVHIAERAAEGAAAAPRLAIDQLDTMAAAARDMLHLALDAFVRGDDDQASQVAARDVEVDRSCAAIIAVITTLISERASVVLYGLRAIRVAKYLERIADHATNVAEEVIFMVRGDDIRRGRTQVVGSPAPIDLRARFPMLSRW